MSDDIDTEYTLTEVPPLTHEQIRATRFQVDSLGIPKMVDRETYEHECELHQNAIRRAAQAEADALAFAEFAQYSAIVADVEFPSSKMENIARLIEKYLDGAK